MNLHEVLMEMAKEHRRTKNGGYTDLLTFNHKTKKISNGKLVLVENGKIVPQTIELVNGTKWILEDEWGNVTDEFYEGMERRFNEYYLSVPSKSERFVRTVFTTKAVKNFTYEDVMKASNNRAIKRYELEWFLMRYAVNGQIIWKNEKHYYWQSKKNPKLIVYKEFI